MPCVSHLSRLVAVVAVVGGCAGRDQASVNPDLGRELVAMPDTIRVRPGETGRLRFVLVTTAGAAVPGATVSFSIIDAPETPGVEAQGATLATPTAVTDAMGVAEAQVTGGLITVFRVHASSGDAEGEAVVVVAAGVVGSVDVAPFFPPGGHAAAVSTSVEVLFFDNSACRNIAPRRPLVPARMTRRLPPSGGVTHYDFVSTAVSNAIVGRARDEHGEVQALGCADLPGTTLIAGGTVQLALPLQDASPDPVGQFAVTSRLQLWPRPAAADLLAAPWRDLADCPLDPGQLWLDCSIDALSPASAADPNDCVPATAPMDEGAIGTALAARRGVLLTGADGHAGACRGARDATGAVSADALAMALFGSPLPRTVVQLDAIADDAYHLLDAVTLRSQLEVRASTRDGVYQVTHTLNDAVFGSGDTLKEVQLQTLGLPVLEALTTATVHDDVLAIDAHGFTLRLGTAARDAFATLGLGRRALPGDAAGFVATLVGLAHTDDGKAMGCAALDAALCPSIGRGAGCLEAACRSGLDALGARLDGSFNVANGVGLDLTLAGATPLLDRHGTGMADRLGDLQALPPAPGTWSATVRTGDERVAVSGEWEAVRTGN